MLSRQAKLLLDAQCAGYRRQNSYLARAAIAQFGGFSWSRLSQDFLYSIRLCDFIRQASPAPRHPTHGSYERNRCRPLYLSASRTPGSVSRPDARIEAPSENELEGFAVAARQRSDECEYLRAVPTRSSGFPTSAPGWLAVCDLASHLTPFTGRVVDRPPKA